MGTAHQMPMTAPRAVFSIDACVAIAAYEPHERFHSESRWLVEQHRMGLVELVIGFSSKREVVRNPEAVAFVSGLRVVPHHPIGPVKELTGTRGLDCTGTLANTKHANVGDREIVDRRIAKASASRRDRNAYLDGALGHVDAFVTTDRGLGDPAHARALRLRFGLPVLSPAEASQCVSGDQSR